MEGSCGRRAVELFRVQIGGQGYGEQRMGAAFAGVDAGVAEAVFAFVANGALPVAGRGECEAFGTKGTGL